jgi:hypothetical protein
MISSQKMKKSTKKQVPLEIPKKIEGKEYSE